MGDEHKKSRPLYIAQFLRAKTDDTHWVKQGEIMDYLYQELEIMPDRKTIKRDIAMLRDEMGMDIEEQPYYGYRLLSREFELDDLKILAECVYAARFISEKRTKDLIDVLCDFCSNHQAWQLKRDVYLCDRVKTTQDKTLYTLNTIREAISSDPYGRGKKITFHYLTRSISDIHKLIDRHNGKLYKVSPYALVINNGDYYVIAMDDESEEIRHYRIDRMRDVQIVDERQNYRKYSDIRPIKSYVRRTFSMFSGDRTKVEMRFENSLLDAVIDKFGVGFGAEYQQDGDNHFVVKMDVEVSDQFYAWICGFRKKAEILAPDKVNRGMKKFLSDIQAKYE